MIFNEIKCRVITSLGLVWGDASPAPPPVSAPGLGVGLGLEGFKSRLGLEGFWSRDFEFCKEMLIKISVI